MPIRIRGSLEALTRPHAALRIGGALFAAASLVAFYLLIRATGGTPNPLVHLAYLSIIVAAVAAGSWGGIAAGVVAGLMLGPLMPDSTAASATVLAQWGWFVRMAVYIAAGFLVAATWSWARRLGQTEAARQGMREIINVVGREKTSLGACRRLLAELGRWRPTLAAAVYVFEPDGSAYLLAGWSADGLSFRRQEHHTGRRADALRRAAAAGIQRRAVKAEVLSPGELERLTNHGARGELVVPLRLDGTLVGVLLLIGAEEPRPVTSIETEALGELGRAAASLVRRAQQEEDTVSRKAADLVRQVLDDPARLEPAFQPIVSLSGGGVAGYEALARFRTDLVEPPNVWFERAVLAGLGPELQALAVRRAREVATTARLPMGSFLSVNVSPELLSDPFIRDALAGDLGSLVIELTEEEAIADYTSLRSVMTEYRGRGARFAIDDAGAGYASLRHVTELRPDFIKLDARIVTGLAGDDGRQALVRAMQSFAGDIGATLVAEGVETDEELALLADTHLPILVQGYALARPGPPWPQVSPSSRLSGPAAARVGGAMIASRPRPPA